MWRFRPPRFVALTLLLMVAASSEVGAEDEGECFFDRVLYPDGYEMCQSGTLKRCEDGSWANIGMCRREAMPPPVSGGGDIDYDEDQEDRRERRR